jgi:glutamyl-Q tRNA(Asp) synthetase
VGYIGRFAPSPTGGLHLGSLIAAVASYLHARQAAGQWLLRIEDIDPPREIPGSTDSIKYTLEALGLHWDGDLLLQSTRLEQYAATAKQLLRDRAAFRCSCSRKDIAQQANGLRRYPGTCREKQWHTATTGIRMRQDDPDIHFQDELQGFQRLDWDESEGDYLIVRRDGLPAYHLAVVVDDAFQGISDIVRGADLLPSTPLHLHLQRQLELPIPRYWHIPVATDASGTKLSKQHGAKAITAAVAASYGSEILRLLGCQPPPELEQAPAEELWAWAVQNFEIRSLAGQKQLCTLATS